MDHEEALYGEKASHLQGRDGEAAVDMTKQGSMRGSRCASNKQIVSVCLPGDSGSCSACMALVWGSQPDAMVAAQVLDAWRGLTLYVVADQPR